MPFELTSTTAAGSGISSISRGLKTAVTGAPDASAFAESLGKLVDNVEQTALDANQAVSNMVDKTGDVHEAMIALQRAETTLQMTVQIRNKLVSAYNDIMRMPI
jgi:flagellar hook-basal body complex protein FliE